MKHNQRITHCWAILPFDDPYKDRIIYPTCWNQFCWDNFLTCFFWLFWIINYKTIFSFKGRKLNSTPKKTITSKFAAQNVGWENCDRKKCHGIFCYQINYQAKGPRRINISVKLPIQWHGYMYFFVGIFVISRLHIYSWYPLINI